MIDHIKCLLCSNKSEQYIAKAGGLFLVRDPLMMEHRETLLILRVTSPKSLEPVFCTWTKKSKSGELMYSCAVKDKYVFKQ